LNPVFCPLNHQELTVMCVSPVSNYNAMMIHSTVQCLHIIFKKSIAGTEDYVCYVTRGPMWINIISSAVRDQHFPWVYSQGKSCFCLSRTGSHEGHTWRIPEHWRQRPGIGQSRLPSRHAAGSATIVFCVTASQHRVGRAPKQVSCATSRCTRFRAGCAATTWCQ
jgi:hypothetical protein